MTVICNKFQNPKVKKRYLKVFDYFLYHLQQYPRRPENTGSKTWTNQKGRSSQKSAQFRNHVISCRLGERQYFIVLHQHTDWTTLCRTFYMTTILCMPVIMSNGIIYIAIIKTIFNVLHQFMFR